MIVWTGISFTKKEKVIDVGTLQVSVDKKQTIGWPPYLGGILIPGGLVLIVTDKKQR